ncbi:MAG: hypothetical protein PV344_04150 [Anaplasma sp.]|nr:hypothetical protein [Anaplasma sp.]
MAILRITIYCKRLNFRKDLIFANFANRLRFAKNSSREWMEIKRIINNSGICQHYGSYNRFAKIRTRE